MDEASVREIENKKIEEAQLSIQKIVFVLLLGKTTTAEYLTASGKPAQYGPVDFDLSSGRITPILNANESLHSMENIKRHIALALDRLKLSGE